MEKGARITDKVDTSNTTLSEVEIKRIFIGGVGAGVTSADMVKTFSPLGSVHAVEFVRTNGRNFAFMDFEPSSVKSMTNLFSTYNGCTWKGGKIKLEIAKEHYLTRLKREWEGDAKLASVPRDTEENLNFDRSQFLNQENSQIRIFFPKLRKVKPLPFKGTGKHKYSFQRVDVSPFPIHFCDCEEHSKALETTSQKYPSPLSTVVHEKEQNVINNVLNKLMGGDMENTTSSIKVQAASGPNTLNPSNEDVHSKEIEVSDTDGDNLMMNFGIRERNDIFMQSKATMSSLKCQESRFGKSQLIQNKADPYKSRKSELTSAPPFNPNKRVRSLPADDFSKREPAPAITQNVTSVLSACETASSIPLTSSRGPIGSHSWVQKSSWKSLVEGEGSSSFNISTLLSGVVASPSTKIEVKSNAPDTTARPKKPEPFGEKPKQIQQVAQITQEMKSRAPPCNGSLHHLQEKTIECKRSTVHEQRNERAELRFDGVCPFMRSAESEHQWSKTKAALSGFIKKKSNENSASKFAKGMTLVKR